MIVDPRHYAIDVLLRDGGSIHLRAIRPEDKQGLLALFHCLSSHSLYVRFFGVKTELTERELQYFTELDFVRNVALVATLHDANHEQIIAVGRYMGIGAPGQPCMRAEVAFAVVDAHQGRGLGTLLLEHLAAIARANGIIEFAADVLGENNRMLQVFETSGFHIQRSIDAGVFHVSFPTEATEKVRAAESQRERLAAAQSLRAFFQPRAVAIVGASRQPGTIGQALLTNLTRDGFTGAIYPIHPHAETLNGLPAFARVSAVGQPIDLAIIGSRGQLPSYSFPENAAQALAAPVYYGRWRARPRGTPVTLSPFAHSAVCAVIDRVLEGAVEPLRVQAADLVTVLRAAGSECAVAEQTTPHEASSTAERLGYPLVAKALSPDVLHKSDVGGVILGLDSVAAVTAAVGTLVERFEKLGARRPGARAGRHRRRWSYVPCATTCLSVCAQW
jgi:GNAT superfamily N-acetyltransferase/predicted CoA-binding protein